MIFADLIFLAIPGSVDRQNEALLDAVVKLRVANVALHLVVMKADCDTEKKS